MIDYEELPFVLHSEDAHAAGRAAVWDELPDNIAGRTRFGDSRRPTRPSPRATMS